MEGTHPGQMVVVDIGKHKKKNVKRLRKGEGKLMDKVDAAVEEVKAGLPEGSNPTIVLVVREKRRGISRLLPR